MPPTNNVVPTTNANDKGGGTTSSSSEAANAQALINPTSQAFEAHYVLQQLKKRPEMEAFYRKYESTLNALISSYTNVERLSKKCEQLNQDILIMATKVKTAQKLVAEDQQQMSLIKKEIEKQWSIYDTAKQKDKEAQAKLDELQEKCNLLQKEIQLGVVNDDRKKLIEQLEETEQKLKKEYDLEQNMKIGLINTVTRLQTQYDDLIKQREQLLSNIQSMSIQITDIEKLTKEEQTERDKAKFELDEAKALLKSKLKDIEEKKMKLEHGEIELQKYEQKQQSKVKKRSNLKSM
ncbi:hypothetical protein C9374_006212 [Naegleria lovaniensis]|uniref:Uncharacterized protein n=1 Tax=Naegleria lovaniensis TaxID=51637 RepID=A0AA88KJG8_NAELO|nr:uncharacterized protein C9374_006212 [Naegleria lovaniensis]KAG2381828.1 hypothetical protein C9374_006212 [Naegleria lovaniensis]